MTTEKPRVRDSEDWTMFPREHPGAHRGLCGNGTYTVCYSHRESGSYYLLGRGFMVPSDSQRSLSVGVVSSLTRPGGVQPVLDMKDLFILRPSICLLTNPVVFGYFFLESG